MLLVVGVLAALWEAQRSGRGQVVDAAMVDGASLLSADGLGVPRARGCGPTSATRTCSTGTRRSTTPTPAPTGGTWRSGRSSRSSTRRCWPGSAWTEAELPPPVRPGRLAELRARFTEVFGTRTRDEWAAVFDGTDACVTPVLAFGEVAEHPHLAARGTIVARTACPRPPRRRASPARPRTSRRRAARPSRWTGPRRLVVAAPGSRGRHAGRTCRATRAGQAEVSSTSRLRVRFGSTGMPGPVVVETVTFLM